MRRKLDDVSHKLDILYDKLRAQCLSPATLQGLHTILQHIWQYDYQGCMQVMIQKRNYYYYLERIHHSCIYQVISGLIAGGSFAEMSEFMPGVKVLLQLAQQQGVYVEYQKWCFNIYHLCTSYVLIIWQCEILTEHLWKYLS